MGGRTTYRTLSPKRAPFQVGIDWWSHLRNVPRRRISHTYPMLLWGHSVFKISLPGPDLHGAKWLLWHPHIQSPTLDSRCRINKGLIKRGSRIDHWRSRCKGWILWPAPYTYIHTLACLRKLHGLTGRFTNCTLGQIVTKWMRIRMTAHVARMIWALYFSLGTWKEGTLVISNVGGEEKIILKWILEK
jgi:hypothetical protein